MRSKLLRLGLMLIILFGVLLSIENSLDDFYGKFGDANKVRSMVLSVVLILGATCLVLFFDCETLPSHRYWGASQIQRKLNRFQNPYLNIYYTKSLITVLFR